jgi:hypothetical protein
VVLIWELDILITHPLFFTDNATFSVIRLWICVQFRRCITSMAARSCSCTMRQLSCSTSPDTATIIRNKDPQTVFFEIGSVSKLTATMCSLRLESKYFFRNWIKILQKMYLISL